MISERYSSAAVVALLALLADSLAGGALLHAQAPARAEREKKKNPYQRSKLTRSESEDTADRRDVLLTIGEDYTLDLDFDPDWDKIVIGNTTVLAKTDIKANRQIILKPLKDGETTVQLRDSTGTLKLVLDVSVTKSNLTRRARELKDLLRDVEGIKIRVIGQRILIEGEVLVPSDYSQVLNILKDEVYKSVVINQVRLSAVGLQLLAKKIEEEIQKFAPKVTTRVVNSVILVEGVYPPLGPDDSTIPQGPGAPPPKDKNFVLIERTVNLYAPSVLPGTPPALGGDTGVKISNAAGAGFADIRVTADTPPPPPPDPNAAAPQPPAVLEPQQFRVTVHFVELSKDYSKIFGFKWQPGFTADPQITVGATNTGQSSAGGTSFSGTISSLFPKLRSAQNAGFARILKTATVLTRDQAGASITQETGIPMTVIGTGGVVTQTINRVAFELNFEVYSTAGTDSVYLKINKFSNGAVIGKTNSGAPITSVNNVITGFYMNSGDSAALAAFSTTDIGTDFNKDDPRAQMAAPGDAGAAQAGGAPAPQMEPLFTLLTSKSYRKKKSQVVIFITPEKVNNPAKATEDLKKNFRIRVK